MVQWIAIVVALVCLSGSSFSRSWVGFDNDDIGSWEADPDDERPGPKFKYYGRPASEESYKDYNEGYNGYGNDAYTLNNQAYYHNDRDGHSLGYDRNHYYHHQYRNHGYKDHWGPHGHNSQSGFSGQSGQYGGSHGHPGGTHTHPGQHWGSCGHHSGSGSYGQHWGSHGHPSQPGSGQPSQNSGPRGLPQNNVIPPQRSSNDADRVVFPDFNNQVPTTRAPQPVTTSTTTVRPTTTDRTLLDLVICIRACPTTSEYNPVCGTNDVTYNNPGALQCARSCGLDVGVARQAPCPRAVPQIPQPNSTARPITDPTTRTTVSGQTTRATPITRPTTVKPTAAPTMNPTRFTNINVNFNRPESTTIPLDILQSVFGNFGTASPTINNNEELEFDIIDKRINPWIR